MPLPTRWILNGVLMPLSRLPAPVMYALSRGLAWGLGSVVGYRRKVVETQLGRAFPAWGPGEVRAVSRAFYRNFADIVVESVRHFTMGEAEAQRRMRYEGTECLEAFHRAGRHVVVAGGHMNNWELYALTADRPVSHQVTAIYKRLADPVMDEAMRKTRERLGLKMVPTVEAQAWAAAHLQPEARPLQAVVFGFDQSPADPRKSWWTTFLNQETAWYFGLEKLACQYNLPVVYGQIKRTHRGHYVTRYEVLVAEPALCAEGDVLRACIDRLERDIRERPAEWLWTHKRWKHRRPEGAPLHGRERGTGVGTEVWTEVGTGVQRDEEDGRVG